MQTINTNIKINASTQFSGFNFNSMCVFNGVALGAGPDGLYKICCSGTDSGTAIDAYFTTMKTNFGTLNKKRARYIYAGCRSGGEIAVEITGDDKTTAGPYIMAAEPTEGQQRRRVTVGQGLSFGYANLKFSNVLGCDFAIDEVEAEIEERKYGGK
jgi:hypothetical protein